MKNFKKVISILLCVLLAFSSVSVCVSAEDFKALPTVYIKGAAGNLRMEAGNEKSQLIYPLNIPDGYIGDACKELAVPLGEALLMGDWAEYNAGLYDACYPIYKDFACDKDGNAVGKSGCQFMPSTNVGRIYHSAKQTPIDYPVWNFEHDWRLDPGATADKLHEYIRYVKSKTGADRVNVIARCLGTNIMLAYFDKYGAKDINDCIFVCAGFDGFETIEAVFTGKIKFDGASVDRFINCYLSTDEFADDPTFEMVRYLSVCLEYIKVLGFSADVLQLIVDGINDGALKKIVRESLGTMPGFWSYIGNDCYDAAKKYLFGGVEDEYAGVIEKADAFHEILADWSGILDSAEKDGARIYNVCKYGFQMVPITGVDNRMSDSVVTTKVSSFGATCSTLTGKLSQAYLLEADPNYISADKQIDASTCKYPDHTWFVKNISHRNMPSCLDYLYVAIIENDGYTTVKDLEEYPQFIVAADDNLSISALDAKNGNTQEKMETSALNALFRLLFRIIALLVNLLADYVAANK